MTDLLDAWLRLHPGGWTLADIEALPEGSRVEAIDGTLIVQPRPLPIHQRILRRLASALEPGVPSERQLDIGIDVMLAEEPLDYVAPDVVVYDRRLSLTTTRPIPGQAVLLVVEVVSRESRRADRGSKPLAYADAGVPHYWRVESPESGALTIAVHTFELNSGEYIQTGEHTGRLSVTTPVSVDIVLSELTG